jgi:branched-chain amino acid aminotransferase
MQHFSRAANGGIGLLKLQVIMLQFYPTSLANAAGFQQVIWTDTYKIGRSWYNECVFQNNDTFTAPTSENPDGITRKSY